MQQGRRDNQVGMLTDGYDADVAAFPAALADSRRLVVELSPPSNTFYTRSGSAPAGGAIPADREGPVGMAAARDVDSHDAPAGARTAAAFGPGEDVVPSSGLDAGRRDGGQGRPPACDGAPVHTPSAASVPSPLGADTPAVPEPSSGTVSPLASLAGEPLCRPSRTWAMLGLAAAIGVAILAVLALCSGCRPGELRDAAVRTRFAPPTTAPSATPAARAAVASNDAAAKTAGDATARAAGLTPENLAEQKPLLLADLGRLADAIRDAGSKLASAVAAAAANDAAVRSIARERDDARALVGERDGTIVTLTAERDEAKRGEHAAQVGKASVAIGFLAFVGVLELGAGWVIAAAAGVLAYALTPFAIDDIRPWIKWGMFAAAVAILFLKEAKTKGGILAAIHDRFAGVAAAAAANEGKVAA